MSIKKEGEKHLFIPIPIQCFENFNGVPIHAACKKQNPSAKNMRTSGVQAKYLGQQMTVAKKWYKLRLAVEPYFCRIILK